jgi:hypothetical protein
MNLTKPVKIFICADGTITYGDRPFNGAALPVHSVDTPETAHALQILLGKLQYREHPDLPGKPWYRFTVIELIGDVDKLPEIGQLFQDAEGRIGK